MKTVQDLIDKLNETKEDEGFYYLSEKHKGMLTVDYRMGNESWSIAVFDKLNKVILLTTNKSLMNWEEMYWISKYALEHPYDDWFEEKKYNIIIGKDSHSPIYAAYKKPIDNEYIVSSHVFKDELRNDDELQFTEKDVEELKDCLPDYLSKIIDLGKTEVEDERKTF